MTGETDSAGEQAAAREKRVKDLLRSFVVSEAGQIQAERSYYNTATIREKLPRLVESLCAAGEGRASAFQHAEDAMRYLALYLADSGRHRQAMTAAVILNDLRVRYHWLHWWNSPGRRSNLGRLFEALLGQARGYVTGHNFRPLRVARCALAVWLAFGLAFFFMSLCTESYSGASPIIVHPASMTPLKPAWYHWLYFSGVTLTTLGYGDIVPNTDAAWGFVPSFMAFGEACVGYALLGLLVAVFWQSIQTHTYARLAQWAGEFETAVLDTAASSGRDGRLYTFHWTRYEQQTPSGRPRAGTWYGTVGRALRGLLVLGLVTLALAGGICLGGAIMYGLYLLV